MFILIPESFKDLFAFPQLDKQGEEKSNLKKIIVFCYKKGGNKSYLKIWACHTVYRKWNK